MEDNTPHTQEKDAVLDTAAYAQTPEACKQSRETEAVLAATAKLLKVTPDAVLAQVTWLQKEVRQLGVRVKAQSGRAACDPIPASISPYEVALDVIWLMFDNVWVALQMVPSGIAKTQLLEALAGEVDFLLTGKKPANYGISRAQEEENTGATD